MASVNAVSAGPFSAADAAKSIIRVRTRYLFPIDTGGGFCPNSTVRKVAEAASRPALGRGVLPQAQRVASYARIFECAWAILARLEWCGAAIC